jgi:hypothetical protein
MIQRSKVGRKLPERDRETGIQAVSRARIKTEGSKFSAAFGDWEVARELVQQLCSEPDDPQYDAARCLPDLPPEKQSRPSPSDSSSDVDLDLVLSKIIALSVQVASSTARLQQIAVPEKMCH